MLPTLEKLEHVLPPGVPAGETRRKQNTEPVDSRATPMVMASPATAGKRASLDSPDWLIWQFNRSW